MARQIVLEGSGEPVHLTEVLADNEDQLQRKLVSYPKLLPIEEFGLTGPIMIVGRETSLPSGAADLLALTPAGDLLVVEFKTGPQNSDFRHSLAQLLDYGAALWEMDVQEFEASVAVRYFASSHCPPEAPSHDAESLAEAARASWSHADDEVHDTFHQRLERVLERGSFHYVVAAQRFTTTMRRTIEHLNDQASSARFYAVEIVRFSDGHTDAYEGRAVVTPRDTLRGTKRSSTDERELLDLIPDEEYRSTIEQLLTFCRGQNISLEWGATGVSMRVRVHGSNEPVSIGWLYPPGTTGWMGLKGLTLGIDLGQLRKRVPRDDRSPFHAFEEGVKAVPGSEPIKVGSQLPEDEGDTLVASSPSSLSGAHLPKNVVIEEHTNIMELMASVVEELAARG
jgi:hypothetical protein